MSAPTTAQRLAPIADALVAEIETIAALALELDSAGARQVYDALSAAQTAVGRRSVMELVHEVGDRLEIRH
jgi:hypothetical protein